MFGFEFVCIRNKKSAVSVAKLMEQATDPSPVTRLDRGSTWLSTTTKDGGNRPLHTASLISMVYSFTVSVCETLLTPFLPLAPSPPPLDYQLRKVCGEYVILVIPCIWRRLLQHLTLASFGGTVNGLLGFRVGGGRGRGGGL